MSCRYTIITEFVTHCYSLITLSLVPQVNQHTMSLNIKLSYNTSIILESPSSDN